ncbi:hypothetical protein Hanom_Chr04g00335141 [Helianthus anomalus]
MMNTNFGKHSIVLDFRLPQRRAIVRYDDQLACIQTTPYYKTKSFINTHQPCN